MNKTLGYPWGRGRLVTIETFLGPARVRAGCIIITCSRQRAYHELYSTWSFPGPAKTACPALLRDRASSSMPRPESVSCSLSFARTVALTKACAKLCAPEIWDTSSESTFIGQQDFGVEDQGMLPDVPSRVGGAAGYVSNSGAMNVWSETGQYSRVPWSMDSLS